MRKMRGMKLESLRIDTAEFWRDNEVTVLTSLLAAATEWRVDILLLYGATTAASWAALAREAGRGTIRSVRVDEENLREARVEEIQAVWAATEGEWGDYSGSTYSGSTYAKKSEGAAGLRKLLKRAGKLTLEEKPVSRRKCIIC